MREISQNSEKFAAPPRKDARLWRAPASSDREKVAKAIHHCLKYLSEDARELGLPQTASILDMVAHLAMDEARSVRPRG